MIYCSGIDKNGKLFLFTRKFHPGGETALISPQAKCVLQQISMYKIMLRIDFKNLYPAIYVFFYTYYW